MTVSFFARRLGQIGLGSGIVLSTLVCSKSLSAMANSSSPFYDFKAIDIDGVEQSMSKYAGHVCIVVNVASAWGKTAVNYQQLVALHKKYAEAEGLRILAFPCNQFGSQEPGTSAEIKAFAENKGIEWGKGFDLYSKIDVNGKNAHPIWEYLKSKQGGLLGKGIKWNFTKFVVNKEGEPVKRFGPMDDPIPKVEAAIKELF